MGEVILERAARIDDTIEHSSAFFGALLGFGLGLLAGIALVALFAVTGPMAIFLLVAGAALLGSSIGQWLGARAPPHEAGDVAQGAMTVFVGGRTRNASRVGDQVKCHSGEVIVSGLLKIFIEGKNATRMTEETSCDGDLKKDSGCETVYYGGESVQLIEKRFSGELPRWFFVARELLSLATLVCGWRVLIGGWSKLTTFGRIYGAIASGWGTGDKGLSYTAMGARALGNEDLASGIGAVQDHAAYRTVSWGLSAFSGGRRVYRYQTRFPGPAPAATVPQPSRIIIPQRPQLIVPPKPQIIVPQTPRIITPQTPRIITPQTPQIIVPQTPKIIIPTSSYIPPYPGPG